MQEIREWGVGSGEWGEEEGKVMDDCFQQSLLISRSMTPPNETATLYPMRIPNNCAFRCSPV
jgi:hypothetical protein